ncbi:MAG: dockerin type I repeat-containing protein [Oscillospiraceae bacterium]|nr:dockerin type I repeat-containing protein [Oscillospiraceae bacterium]
MKAKRYLAGIFGFCFAILTCAGSLNISAAEEKKIDIVLYPKDILQIENDMKEIEKYVNDVLVPSNIKSDNVIENGKITVAIKHKYSELNKKWTPEELGIDNVDHIVDLTVPANDPTVGKADYDNYKEFISGETFHQHLLIELKNNGVEEILNTIKSLEKSEKVLCVSLHDTPNSSEENDNSQSDESNSHELFEKLIEMSDEEIMNISEEYKTALQQVLVSPVFYEQCRYELNFTDASKYLDSTKSVINETLINDLGIPAELVKEILGPVKSDIDDKIYTTIHLSIKPEGYKDYSAYDTVKTLELMLRTNKQITLLRIERSGKAYDKDFFFSDNIITGDITSDGVIDLTDLSFLSLYLLRDKEFTDNQLKAADVDGDGDVHLTDLARMRQYVVEQIVCGRVSHIKCG